MLLIFDIPILNNEIISSKRIIMPIDNNFGSVSKIRSFSSISLSNKP